MKRILALVMAGVWAGGLGMILLAGRPATGGEPPPPADYKVLSPIAHGNLTIFPVVASVTHDTRLFVTLDEGLRLGEVVITEAGRIPPLVRRQTPLPPRGDGAEVNRLVLVNNSDHPLILLAGEIVTGGKQDRTLGKDRIIPANSDPIDLAVFCVEPHRWTGVGEPFGGLPSGAAGKSVMTPMAQPSVRSRAMAEQNQAQVWDSVNQSVAVMAKGAPVPATSSYARVMASDEVKKQVEAVAAPVETSYQDVMRALRAQHAVGVVVAVRGEIIWADIFASTPLLEKYWPKLVRSYAAESLTRRAHGGQVSTALAERFLDDWNGRRQIVETEPGVYRHTEIVGDGFHAFALASLLPKTGFDVHLSKMSK